MRSHLNLMLALLTLSAATYFLNSCNKNVAESNTGTTDSIHIKLVSGDNQSAIIGHELPEQLYFKVSRNTLPYFGGYLVAKTIDCDGLVRADTNYIFPVSNPAPGFEMIMNISWKLNATIGQQSLTAVLLDSAMIPMDSVKIMATGLAPGPGWHATGCIDDRSFPRAFLELSNGKLFTALNGKSPLYYSTSKGVQWNRLSTFPSTEIIKALFALSDREIILSTEDNGIFYSPDEGETWQQRNNGLPVPGFKGGLTRAKGNNFFAYTGVGDVYLTHDAGVNWSKVQNGLEYYSAFTNTQVLKDGTVIALIGGKLVESKDEGLNWSPVWTISGTSNLSFVFVDESDHVYVGNNGSPGMSQGIYVSKDKMQTWNKVYESTAPPGFVPQLSQMSKRNGVYYFYSSSKNILMSTTNFITYTQVPNPAPDNNGEFSSYYLVTKDNYIIASTQSYGLRYRIP